MVKQMGGAFATPPPQRDIMLSEHDFQAPR